MNFRNIVIPIGVLAMVVFATYRYGLPGLAAVGGALVMWTLLYYTRMMTVLKRASNRPVGYVGSAVMLNVKLRPKVPLMHVVALTRSLGERLSDVNAQPEIYRWTDGTNSHVTCEFVSGKLMKWILVRPTETDATDEL